MLTNEIIIKKLEKMWIKAAKKNESPVAAIIVYNNKIIAKAYNKRNKSNKTIDHAEIIAINKANKKIKNWRLNKCTLYCTLEPCEMCTTVIKESRIEEVYYIMKRNPLKKQYNKTKFNNLIDSNKEFDKLTQNYKKLMKNFWENKR